MFSKFFSFEGRIRRWDYWASLLVTHVIFSMMIMVSIYFKDYAFYILNMIVPMLILPILWFLLAQGAKRCHDCGFSGWWQLVPFVLLWMLFAEGNPGPNQYGDHPKDK